MADLGQTLPARHWLAVLLLALPLAAGCAKFDALRDEQLIPPPWSDQLGVSAEARSIESSLGVQ